MNSAAALRLLRCALVALAVCVVSAPATAQVEAAASTRASPTSAAAHPLDAADVNAWLDGYMPYAIHADDVAGAVVVVVKDGHVLTQRGYGWADVARHRPIDPERTLFRVGSVSKLFTWTAVMQQVAAGRLDLDRDVNAYLDFRIPAFQGQPVTLRQLMTHTAGFELAGRDTLTFGPPLALGRYLKRWIPARIYAPGTTPAYSNWGAALTGYIVQRASGEVFETYVEHHILAPLGMAQASFRQPLPPALAPWVAQGYPLASQPAKPFEVVGPAPAGAMAASGGAMARFMIAHLANGGGILPPRFAAMMHDSPLDRVNPRSLIPPLDRAELGFLQSDINGRFVIGHLGDTQYFHTLLALFPEEGIGLFASFNSTGKGGLGGLGTGPRAGLFQGFADRYFPEQRVATRVDPGTARTHARMMAGQWQNSMHAEHSFLALATLVGQTKVAVTEGSGLVVPSLTDLAGAPLRWQEIAPFVWQARGGHERLAAQVVGGQVMRWSTDTLAPTAVFDRVPASRSAAWLLPALGLSVAVLLLTGLHGPAGWLLRRHYRMPHRHVGAARHAYRAVRIVSLLDLVVLGGWMALFAAMFADLSRISARSDGVLRLLQVSGAIVFVGAVGIAGWNVWTAWRGPRWSNRLWSLAILLATVTLLYVAWSFGLLAQGTDY